MTIKLPPILSEPVHETENWSDDDYDYANIACDMYLTKKLARLTSAQRIAARIKYIVDYNKGDYIGAVY